MSTQADVGLPAAVAPETVTKYDQQIKELQHLVRFYEKRLTASPGADSGSTTATGADASSSWILEEIAEAGLCYLWERRSGRVFSDAPEGQWPKPIGMVMFSCLWVGLDLTLNCI